ncbi:MAG: hypothetical protein WCP06_00800 [Verrucomicrobiota bacterium]
MRKRIAWLCFLDGIYKIGMIYRIEIFGRRSTLQASGQNPANPENRVNPDLKLGLPAGSRSGIPAASFQGKAAGSRFYYGAENSCGAQVHSFPDE